MEGHAFGQGIQRRALIAGNATLLGNASGKGEQQQTTFRAVANQLTKRLVVVRERFHAQLYAEEPLAQRLVAYALLVLADKGTDENSSTAGCDNATVHVIPALVIVEITAHMYCNEGRIEQPHLAYSREAPRSEAHITLNDEEVTMLAAKHEAAGIVADIVNHVLQLALVDKQAVMVAFLPKRAQGRIAVIARIRATPNRRSAQIWVTVGCPAYLRGGKRGG